MKSVDADGMQHYNLVDCWKLKLILILSHFSTWCKTIFYVHSIDLLRNRNTYCCLLDKSLWIFDVQWKKNGGERRLYIEYFQLLFVKFCTNEMWEFMPVCVCILIHTMWVCCIRTEHIRVSEFMTIGSTFNIDIDNGNGNTIPHSSSLSTGVYDAMKCQ